MDEALRVKRTYLREEKPLHIVGIEFLRVLRKIENEFELVIFDGREFQRREPARFRGDIVYPLRLHKTF